MAMTMKIAIQQAFRPLFITCFIIGLGVYPSKELKPRDDWVVYLSILYSSIVWFVYGYLLYYMVSSLSLRALCRATISIIVMEINIITTITSVIFSVYYDKRFRICMKKLAAVDDTLEDLGTPKIYRKIHMWSKRIVIGWLIYSLVVNYCDTKWWLDRKETTSWGFIVPHLYNHSLHVNTLVDLVFITFMWYIGTRFDKVQEHMQCLLVKEKRGLRNTWEKFAITCSYRYTLYAGSYKQILWSSMHLHLELCRIARELNLIFGTQMTFEIASYLLFLTSSCYYLYGMLMRKDRTEIPIIAWYHISSWTTIFVTKLCVINCICENVSAKANKIDKVVHQLTNALRYSDIKKEIHQFILQRMHRPLKFSGMGLFYFGNQFLRKCCMTITTIMIILIQMLKV